MSLIDDKTLAMILTLKSNTYYVTSRSDITLSGNQFKNLVVSWGAASFFGNSGTGTFETGAFDIALNSGEQIQGGGFVFDPTDVWNNYTAEVKRFNQSDVDWEQGTAVKKGKIKNHKIDNDIITFSIEDIDSRDDILLPAILCQDQSDLSDAEARTTMTKVLGGSGDLITVTDVTIFEVGELILLIEGTGNKEYARIKSIDISLTRLTLYEDLTNSFPFTKTNYAEKPFRNIPKESINKTIPIQIGNLAQFNFGVFAKSLTIDQEIGSQAILFDTINCNAITNIGMWESGTRRYFIARKSTTAGDDGEYEIKEKNVLFTVNSGTILTGAIVSIAEGNDIISVSDYTAINWINEDSLPSWQQTPEGLSANVIGVDNELMLVIKKPESNDIHVERGYKNTDIETHSNGSQIFQSGKYSARNVLSFTERFDGKVATNQYYENDSTSAIPPFFWWSNEGTDTIQVDANGQGKISNCVDSDTSTYMDMESTFTTKGPGGPLFLNFDVIYPKIKDNFNVLAFYNAFKIDGAFTIPGREPPAINQATIQINVWNPEFETTADQGIPFPGDLGYHALYVNTQTDDGASLTFDFSVLAWDIIDRSRQIISFYPSGLTDLNKKWKYQIYFAAAGSAPFDLVFPFNINIYTLGMWVDFFVDYTTETILGALEGRSITADVATITNAEEGSSAIHPVDVMALLLTQELGYTTDDFDAIWEDIITPYAYVTALASSSVSIVDITGQIPEIIKTINDGTGGAMLDFAHGVYNNGIYCYVTGEDSDAMNLFDISIPSAATLVGLVENGDGGALLDRPMENVVVGNYCYVIAEIDNAMSIFDVSIPASPTYVSSLGHGGDVLMVSPHGIWCDGTICYVVSVDSNSLEIINVSNPENPFHLGSLTNADLESAHDIDVVGRYVYVSATEADTMVIIDAITLTNPIQVGKISHGGNVLLNGPYGLKVYDNIAYICAIWSNAVEIVDVSVPSSPAHLGSIAHGGNVVLEMPTTLEKRGDFLYVCAEGSNALTIIDVSKPTVPTWVTSTISSNFNLIHDIYIQRDQVQTTQACAFSYGVDDKRKKGWDFVSEIGSHFNYQIFKNYEGKIDIINLYKIYQNTQAGNQINIEDMLWLSNGNRRIKIWQTGVDLLYNDIVIKWRRNNSTDEYQDVYTLPDSYELSKSGITLLTARENYYDGKKRTLEIESPFLYNETDAQRLAEWHADDKAEVHFYSEVYLDFDHYTDINSLSAQYKIGDIMYLNGKHGGIDFDSPRKFYVQDVIFTDAAREIKLHMKSVDPVSEFTAY